MRQRLARALSSPSAALGICALGLLLCSPALSTGLTADDYFHKLVLRGSPSAPDAIDARAIPRGLSQLFVWADGDEARAHAMMEIGMTGWWTNPQLVMAYFRPLSAATHWLDYQLWPDAPFLMHVHSLGWLLLAWLGLWALYRHVLGPSGASGASRASVLPALALLLYVVDDARAMTVAWVANRNALVALALAVPVLLLHLRSAQSGSRAQLVLAALGLLAALLAGESALAITAYLFAYALCLDPGGVRRGLLRLVPHAAVTLSWAIAYRALGYGARGSGLVIDPGGHPLWFAQKLLERVPVLLAGQLGFPPSDAWEAYPALASSLPAVMMGVALVTLAGFAWLALPVLRSDPRARFFGLGALLAAIPVCAQFPHDRLLPFIGLGAMGLTALVLEPWLARAPDMPRLRRIACHAFAGLHLVLAPVWLPLRVRGPLDVERMVSAADRSIDASPSVRGKTVVLMNPPVDAYAGYVPPMRAAQGRPRPRAIRWLATGASDTVITRVDAHTLRVRPEAGFLALPSERMQRDPRDRIPLGHVVPLADLAIEVTALTDDGRPAEILARFAAPLEDARYLLMYWDRGAFRTFTPPPPGASMTLAKVDFASLLP